MNQSVSLANYIDEWMTTYKAYSVRQSTFDRLLTSIKALESYTIASMPIGEITAKHIQLYVNELANSGYVKILSRLLGHADVNITYNIYVHLYGDGFDEMYSALVPKG